MNLENKIFTAAEKNALMAKLNELVGFPNPALQPAQTSIILKGDSTFNDECGQRNDENPRGATSYRGGGWHPDSTSLRHSGGHSFHPPI